MKLFMEKAELETATHTFQEEAHRYDAKFAALGQPAVYAIPMLEQQAADAEKESATIAIEVSEIASKVTALEQALKTSRPKVDAFKAGQLK